MCNPCVFVHFAKQVLTIYKLQATVPECFEENAEPFEFSLLSVGYPTNQISLAKVTIILETLADTASGTGTRNHEIHFVESCQLAVVQVCRVLIREKVADSWIGAQQIKHFCLCSRFCNSLGQPVSHHPSDQFEMHSMFSAQAPPRRHDV